MAFDYTQLNAENCPNRWKVIAKYLKEQGPDQLAILDDSYKAMIEHIYASDFSESNVPVIQVTLDSSNVDGATFNVIDLSGQVTSYDGDYSIKVYDGVAPAAPTPSTEFVVTDGSGTITYEGGDKPVAGKHLVFAFDGTDEQGESASATVELVYAPSEIDDVAASDNTDGTATVTFTEATGAASHTLYWMAVTGGETAQDVVDGAIAGGTVVTDPDPSGEDFASGAGDFGFVVVATNPGGSTNSNLSTVEVTA